MPAKVNKVKQKSGHAQAYRGDPTEVDGRTLQPLVVDKVTQFYTSVEPSELET